MRILHTMLRTTDLDRSIDFYTEVLGMQLTRRQEYPDGEFTLAFLGFADDPDGPVIELTYNCSATATATSPSRSMTSTRPARPSVTVAARSSVMQGR